MTETDNNTVDAIIFIPGLGEWVDQSAEGMARRIAVALDRNATTAQAEFNVESGGKDEIYQASSGQTKKTQVRAIIRNYKDQKGSSIDFYTMDYGKSLTKNYQDENLLVQSFRLFLAIVRSIPRLLRAFIPKYSAKKTTEKFQLVYATAILALLVVYMIFLFLATIDTVRQSPEILKAMFPGGQPTATPSVEPTATSTIQPTPAPADQPAATTPNQSGARTPLTVSQAIIILVAIVQVFIPNLKQKITNGAINYVGAIDYISLSERQNVIAGQLADLLEHIAEKGTYRHIHIVAFSFGSIIAIDNLFPSGSQPGARYNLIHSLVTIGCPFDLVRLYWPNYFKDRHALPGIPQKWFNIYSPVDVLSSNFRDDAKQERAEKSVNLAADAPLNPPENVIYTGGVNPNNLEILDWINLLGFRTHGMYWRAEEEAELSCFSVMTSKMYEGDLLLS
jgi:hypothetical protein